MCSTPRSVRFASVTADSECLLSNHARLGELASLLFLLATVVCGAWTLASAQDNPFDATVSVRTPLGRPLAMPAGRAITLGEGVKAQDSSTPAPGPLIYTIAGGNAEGYSGDGGPSTAAGLLAPQSVAVDSTGNVFIADGYNFVIRKITAATGVISTVAGTGTAGYSGDGGPATSAQIGGAYGQDNAVGISVALDASGNLYIADAANNVIRKVTATTGVITTIAGTGTAGFSGDSGSALNAELNSPSQIAFDGAGNLYFLDSGNHRVREIVARTGIIRTIAGGGINGLPANGQSVSATSVWLGYQGSIAADQTGNVYIGAFSGSVIAKVDPNGLLTVYVAGTSSGLNAPITGYVSSEIHAMAIDSANNLYIADYLEGIVQKVASSPPMVSVVAGTHNGGPSGDGGAATSAVLCIATGVAVGSTGNLYISDLCNASIREVTAAAAAPTTSTAAPIFSVSGGTFATPQTVAITSATIGAAIYVTLDGSAPSTASTIYHGPISVCGPMEIRAIALAPGYLTSSETTATYTITAPPSAVIQTVAGNGTAGFSGAGGPATSASIGIKSAPGFEGITFDAAGDLFFTDGGNNVVWKIAAKTGTISIAAGNGSAGYSGDGGAATGATLNGPSGLAADSAGNLYISDSFNHVVRKVTTATGVISTYAGNGQWTTTAPLLGDGGLATAAAVPNPIGLAIDRADNLYVADQNSILVRKVTATTGIITTVAGNDMDPGRVGKFVNGASATNNGLDWYPNSLTFDNAGNLYIGSGSGGILKVRASDNTISIVAGPPAGQAASGAVGKKASETFMGPSGIALDNAGNLYYTDYSGIRMISATTGLVSVVAGTDYPGFTNDGEAATATGVHWPLGLAIDGKGTLYFADSFNSRIRAVVTLSPAATPTFSLAGGTYYGTRTVTISDSTANATIYFTTDGSTPNTSSEVYTSPIAISATSTLQAIAVATGFAQSATASAAYTINQPITPSITWPTPAAITYGTQLSATQLNATTPVAGNFAYTPALGSVLPVGTQTLKADFTPTDSTTYTTASATVQLVVKQATPVLALTSSVTTAYLSNPVTFTATLTSTAGTPTGTADFYDGATKLGTGTLAAGVATYTTSSLATGAHSITAVYSGDSSFVTVSSTALTETIEDFTFAPAANGASSATAVAGGQATYQLAFGAVGGTTGAQAITLGVSGLPAGATATFSPASIPANSPATNVTLTITLPAKLAAAPAHAPIGRVAVPVSLGLLLLPFAGRLRRTGKSWSKLACILLLTLAGATMAAGVSGCGGGSGSGSTSTPKGPQTYTLLVSATSGTNVHTTSLTLTVN